MKKILLLLILLLPFDVFASVVLIDADTNRVLYGINENEKKLIASTTKIMTAMVVINNTDISKTIKINESILKIPYKAPRGQINLQKKRYIKIHITMKKTNKQNFQEKIMSRIDNIVFVFVG